MLLTKSRISVAAIAIVSILLAFALFRVAERASADNATGVIVPPSAAAKLAFSIPPAGAAPTIAFTTQPVVRIQDANGNTVTSSVAPVTLAITPLTGAAGAVLSGTLTVAAVSGVATFAGLSIDLAGAGITAYTLTATSAGLTAAITSPFNVGAAGLATKLVFTIQPSGSVPGAPFTTQPVVEIQDLAGNTVTAPVATVTLAITPLTGTTGAVLAGTTAVATVSGVAKFTNVSLNLVGAGYTLTATSAGLAASISSAISVAGFGNTTVGNVIDAWDWNAQGTDMTVNLLLNPAWANTVFGMEVFVAPAAGDAPVQTQFLGNFGPFPTGRTLCFIFTTSKQAIKSVPTSVGIHLIGTAKTDVKLSSPAPLNTGLLTAGAPCIEAESADPTPTPTASGPAPTPTRPPATATPTSRPPGTGDFTPGSGMLMALLLAGFVLMTAGGAYLLQTRPSKVRIS